MRDFGCWAASAPGKGSGPAWWRTPRPSRWGFWGPRRAFWETSGVALALIPVAIYFWLIRGHALAAWHGCPVWKGVAATILNMVLAVAMVLLLLAACAVMVLLLV